MSESVWGYLILPFIKYCKQTTSSEYIHILSQTRTFQIFKSFGSNYNMSLIHNNTQMLEKQSIGHLKVTCHFTAAMEIVNCLHKMLFFYNSNFWTK